MRLSRVQFTGFLLLLLQMYIALFEITQLILCKIANFEEEKSSKLVNCSGWIVSSDTEYLSSRSYENRSKYTDFACDLHIVMRLIASRNDNMMSLLDSIVSVLWLQRSLVSLKMQFRPIVLINSRKKQRIDQLIYY